MKYSKLHHLRAFAATQLAAICCSASAQAPVSGTSSQSFDIKPVCQSATATVMISKPSCTAALCNTGSAQGGWAGLAASALNRQSIDAESFSVSVGSMLATALKQTGCFNVFDAAGIEQMRKDMESIGKTLAAPPEADYLVRASVTQADYLVDDANYLVYTKRTTTTSLTLDAKLVNTRSGVVFEAGSYDASNERSFSGVVGIYGAGNDRRRSSNAFSEVAREAVGKATVGLTAKLMAQTELARTSGKPAPVAATAP